MLKQTIKYQNTILKYSFEILFWSVLNWLPANNSLRICSVWNLSRFYCRICLSPLSLRFVPNLTLAVLPDWVVPKFMRHSWRSYYDILPAKRIIHKDSSSRSGRISDWLTGRCNDLPVLRWSYATQWEPLLITGITVHLVTSRAQVLVLPPFAMRPSHLSIYPSLIEHLPRRHNRSLYSVQQVVMSYIVRRTSSWRYNYTILFSLPFILTLHILRWTSSMTS